MLVLLLVIGAVCGVLLRYAAAFWPDVTHKRLGNIEYSDKQKWNKGFKTYHRIGVRLEANICFAITRETHWDWYFKRIGFSQEFQTGDHTFDERIYIASDHPLFCDALRDNFDLRRLIDGLLAAGFDRIWSNGRMLYAATKTLEAPSWLFHLDQIRIELAAAAARTPSRVSDPFVWRALVVESIVWGMAGYAAPAALACIKGLFEHLESGLLLVYGAACAVAVALALRAFIVWFLKRSSRSHRILVESALLLILSTPVIGLQLVANINASGAVSSPIVVRCLVTSHWSEESVGKHNRVTYSRYMTIERIDGEVSLPHTIDISLAVFRTLNDGIEIPIELERGRLGLHWYKSINGVPVGKFASDQEEDRIMAEERRRERQRLERMLGVVSSDHEPNVLWDVVRQRLERMLRDVSPTD